MKASIISAVAAVVSVCSAATSDFVHLGKLVPPAFEAESAPISALTNSSSSKNGSAFFTQWLDHKDHSKGTFQQKFWWNAEFWAGPGSPVVLFTPGEIAAANYGGYLTNQTITGWFAQNIKGAVVMVERECTQ